ncbi:MAG TPA: hypothetical protein VM677_18680 [Actinokineospora sp.]|jgi:hypothetical protein|nr:hypothetical protein [Actinokineospora sp.]
MVKRMFAALIAALAILGTVAVVPASAIDPKLQVGCVWEWGTDIDDICKPPTGPIVIAP